LGEHFIKWIKIEDSEVNKFSEIPDSKFTVIDKPRFKEMKATLS